MVVPFTGIGAVISGHIALFRIKRNIAVFKGRRRALAGLMLGYSQIIILCFLLGFLLITVGIPRYKEYEAVESREKTLEIISSLELSFGDYVRREIRTRTIDEIKNDSIFSQIQSDSWGRKLQLDFIKRERLIEIRSFGEDGVFSHDDLVFHRKY